MIDFKRLNLLCFILLFFLTPKVTFSDNHDLSEVIELLKKDIRTLERAVYSDSFSLNNETTNNTSEFNQNSEEVLTRHLLKLSNIENQFQILTNKFEKIDFKLDNDFMNFQLLLPSLRDYFRKNGGVFGFHSSLFFIYRQPRSH